MNKNILIAIIVILFSLTGLLSYKLIKLSNTSSRALAQNQGRSEMIPEQRNGGNFDQRGSENGGGSVQSRQNCFAEGCLAIEDLNYPAGDLTQEATTSLTKALDDEYKTQATYEAVINKFGNVRPFIMIIRAEEQHISSLKALFDKYGLSIPEDPYTGKIIAPYTLTDACNAGVEAEIANASLYKNELLPTVTQYEDITTVFTNLMNASQEQHLAAFQKCAQ